MPTREERERPVGQGKGGDITAALDEAAERVVLAALRPARRPDRLRGDRDQGRRARSRSSSTRSTARRTPSARSRTSRSASRSPRATTMDDVVFGFVYDFGAGRGVDGGARRRRVPERRAAHRRAEGRHRVPLDRGDAGRARARPSSRKLAPLTDRVRVMGAQAITFCHLAAGRTDAVVVPEAVAHGRLRRRAAARPRARLRDPRDRRARSSGRSRSTSRRARASARRAPRSWR